MSAAQKYQITKVDVLSQFGKQADKSVAAGLEWQDVCKAMEASPDAHIGYALAALADHGRYEFHNEDGKLCEVVNHKLL